MSIHISKKYSKLPLILLVGNCTTMAATTAIAAAATATTATATSSGVSGLVACETSSVHVPLSCAPAAAQPAGLQVVEGVTQVVTGGAEKRGSVYTRLYTGPGGQRPKDQWSLDNMC